jgi:hypothetical protein
VIVRVDVLRRRLQHACAVRSIGRWYCRYVGIDSFMAKVSSIPSSARRGRARLIETKRRTSLGDCAYPSTEREGERFHAGFEKLDLELSVGDRSRLSNQLIQALLGDRAVTLRVDITSMACARRLSVDEYSKGHSPSPRDWSHDEMEIARVKPVCDPPAGSVQQGRLCLQRPFTGKRPVIEAHAGRNGIDVGRVQLGAARRREILRF